MTELTKLQSKLLEETTHTCPRRVGGFGPWLHQEGMDVWEDDYGCVRCQFCGSMHPTEALFRIERGEQVIPTDKNYKAYIGESGGKKLYYQHFSKEQKQRFIELVNDKTMQIGMPGYFYVLPYFAAR